MALKPRLIRLRMMLESSTTINLYTMMGPYQLRVEWESEAEAGKLVGL